MLADTEGHSSSLPTSLHRNVAHRMVVRRKSPLSEFDSIRVHCMAVLRQTRFADRKSHFSRYCHQSAGVWAQHRRLVGIRGHWMTEGIARLTPRTVLCMAVLAYGQYRAVSYGTKATNRNSSVSLLMVAGPTVSRERRNILCRQAMCTLLLQGLAIERACCR